MQNKDKLNAYCAAHLRHNTHTSDMVMIFGKLNVHLCES